MENLPSFNSGTNHRRHREIYHVEGQAAGEEYDLINLGVADSGQSEWDPEADLNAELQEGYGDVGYLEQSAEGDQESEHSVSVEGHTPGLGTSDRSGTGTNGISADPTGPLEMRQEPDRIGMYHLPGVDTGAPVGHSQQRDHNLGGSTHSSNLAAPHDLRSAPHHSRNRNQRSEHRELSTIGVYGASTVPLDTANAELLGIQQQAEPVSIEESGGSDYGIIGVSAGTTAAMNTGQGAGLGPPVTAGIPSPLHQSDYEQYFSPSALPEEGSGATTERRAMNGRWSWGSCVMS